jgi:hypothetical protein
MNSFYSSGWGVETTLFPLFAYRLVPLACLFVSEIARLFQIAYRTLHILVVIMGTRSFKIGIGMVGFQLNERIPIIDYFVPLLMGAALSKKFLLIESLA